MCYQRIANTRHTHLRFQIHSKLVWLDNINCYCCCCWWWWWQVERDFWQTAASQGRTDFSRWENVNVPQARRKSNRRIEWFLWQRRRSGDCQLLNKLNKPKNCPFSCGSRPNPIRGFLGPPDFASKRQLDRFSGFTNVTNWQTDEQTDTPRYSVCSNRPLSLRCGLITSDVEGYSSSWPAH